MPYFVYGNSATTGEPVKRSYSEAATEDEARAEGTQQGMRVTAVVACKAMQRPGESEAANGDTRGRKPGMPRPPAVSSAQRNVVAGVARYAGIAGIGSLAIAALSITIGILSHRVTVTAGINIIVLLITAALTLNVASRFRSLYRAYDTDATALTTALGSVRTLYLFQAVALCLTGAFILLVILKAVL